ncbi:probable E3 ubiquitin-protein ligase HIP1 [Oryza brachyantha]|uniref:RING-type E3 ubiquitin transferase n=1 Tax=Oryza brachyantha TaxID=4533 RepID=J3LVT4_ORYBR|nr:probable E3 ubiquitin-protein ligase HIP1 [Oryza brachyantha]
MHQHKITMLSSSEACHLGSSSNNQAMDQQNLLPSNPSADEQNLLPNTLEDEDYPHYLLSSHEVEMPNGRMAGQQNTSMNLWDSAGSSSMGYVADHDSLFHAKREHFAPPLSIRAPLVIGGRRREGSSSLPSQSLNIDLNLNQADQFESENVDVVQSNGQPGINAFPLNRSLSITEHVLRHTNSSSATGNSSQIANLSNGTTEQGVNIFGDDRSSCKRKNIDGSLAESSANGSSRNHQRNNNILEPSPSSHESTSGLTVPTSTNYVFSFPPAEQLNQNTNMSGNAMLSHHYSLYGGSHESERFLRNTRMRISPNEHDQSSSNLLPEGSLRCSVYQPVQQQSLFIPVQPRASSSSTSTLSRPYVPAVTEFSQNLHRASSSGNFGSRIGISPSSADTTNQLSSQDPSSSSVRNNFPEPLLLGSLFPSDSTELLSVPLGRSNQQNSSSTIRTAVNVGPQQIPGLNASQHTSSSRGSVDIARRSLHASSIPQSRSSSITSQQHRGHLSTSHEIRHHQPGSSSRANQLHYARAVTQSVDRQTSNYLDLQSFMQSITASRDGIRTVSESANQLVHLRNVVEQIRQGRGGRFEDPNFERALFARRASLIDRHRDMRLDVDNMSYEELLALGERIGYVNTGLSEEKIRTGLKQWKYASILFEEPLAGVEPCCICQEEYAAGDDMGRLDCGHDFHTACIKQWLVIKNLCPICKKAGLGT